MFYSGWESWCKHSQTLDCVMSRIKHLGRGVDKLFGADGVSSEPLLRVSLLWHWVQSDDVILCIQLKTQVDSKNIITLLKRNS